MATLPSFTSHTPARAADVQLIIDTLVNEFGITDSIQTNIGRMALPTGIVAPTSPVVGQQWVMTNEGVGSARLYMRDGASKNVPYLPLRKRTVVAITGGASTNGAVSFSDLANFTLSVDTTGGVLEIYLAVKDGTFTNGNYIALQPGASGAVGYIRAVVGATNLGAIAVSSKTTGGQADQGIGALRWEYQPAGGTYVVKLQSAVSTVSGSPICGIYAENLLLVVREYGD